MAGRLFLLLLAVATASGVYAVRAGLIAIPDHWNPWAPLRIDEPLHWLTRYKLERAVEDDAVCLALLDQAEMRFERVADRETASGCGYNNAVRISRTQSRIGEAFTLSCRSAVALALWERHVVEPAAQRHYGASVARLEHFGSYACRNVYGREEGRLSRHATADAFDVAGFVLEGGRRISVARDWGGNDAHGFFLREVHEGACRVFDSVLGPEYNAAHRDHFHLDRGGWRSCR